MYRRSRAILRETASAGHFNAGSHAVRSKHGRFRLSHLATLGLCSILPLFALDARQDDAPPPAPTHYTRTLGPFAIDGHDFTVKLNVTCYKETQHEGEC